MTIIALDATAVVNVLRERLASDPFWQRRLDRILAGDAGLHLAVFREPFLTLLLAGTKTIESRFSVNRVAPYRAVAAEDVVLLKRAAGPVVGVALADAPGYYELDASSWREIRERFAKAICAGDEQFWEQRAHARYATLIPIKAAVSVPPFAVEKRDRRGWVPIDRQAVLDRRWA